MFKIIASSVLLLCSVFLWKWPPKLDKKIHASIEKTYQTKDYSLQAIQLSEATEAATTSAMQGNVYRVVGTTDTLGYIYVAQAPSMKNIFDYIVLFDSDIQVMRAKVLIYREQHGRQIGTRRWLRQFDGLSTTARPELGVNVDGITGATISVNSMTKAMHDLLESMDYLKSNNQL